MWSNLSTLNKVGVAIIVVMVLCTLIPYLKQALKGSVVRVQFDGVVKKVLANLPDTIHLSAKTGNTGINAAAMQKLQEALRPLGFSEAGDYAVDEMPMLVMRFLINTTAKAYAIIYDRGKWGVWVELVTRYQDGSGATFSTSPERGMQHRPEDMVVHASGASAETLYNRMMQERPSKPLLELSAESLPQLFQDAYHQQIAWRKQQGISAAEVVSVISTSKTVRRS